MDHLSAAGSSATRNLTTTEPSESLNRRKTVDFRFQRPHATSRSFFFNKPMRAMDSRRDFTSKKVFSGYFSELGEKANSALPSGALPRSSSKFKTGLEFVNPTRQPPRMSWWARIAWAPVVKFGQAGTIVVSAESTAVASRGRWVSTGASGT